MKIIWLVMILSLIVLTLFSTVAIAAETGAEKTDLAKGLLTFGISTVGSLLIGKVKKSITKLPNDMIPVTNGTMFGGGSAIVSGGDPVTMLSGFAGAVAASLIHKTFQKLFS